MVRVAAAADYHKDWGVSCDCLVSAPMVDGVLVLLAELAVAVAVAAGPVAPAVASVDSSGPGNVEPIPPQSLVRNLRPCRQRSKEP